MSVTVYINRILRGEGGTSPLWLSNMLHRGAFSDLTASMARWHKSCWGTWRSRRLWKACGHGDEEQGGSRTWQALGRVVTSHLDWRRVFAGTCETDGELQRWAKWIFNNTNSAQFELAVTSLLPTASVVFQKCVPTSSAKVSMAQQRRGATPWDSSFTRKGKSDMEKAVPVTPSSCGRGRWFSLWTVHRGS